MEAFESMVALALEDEALVVSEAIKFPVARQTPSGLLTAATIHRAAPDERADVLAVVFHPGSRRAVGIGPFTRASAQQWWTARHNRSPLAGTQMAVLDLIPLGGDAPDPEAQPAPEGADTP